LVLLVYSVPKTEMQVIPLGSGVPDVINTAHLLTKVLSIMNVIKELGGDPSELTPLTKYLLIHMLDTYGKLTYINGAIEELSTLIRCWLWELSSDEVETLYHLLNIAELMALSRRGYVSKEEVREAKEVTKEFLKFLGIDLSKAVKVREVINAQEPNVIKVRKLTSICLIALTLSLGGLSIGNQSLNNLRS